MTLTEQTQQEISDAIDTVQRQEPGSGEINVTVSKPKKRKLIDPINPFGICFVGSLSTMIQNRKLTPTALALLFALLELSAFGNLVSVNQAGLAKRLGVKQPAVSKALAKLEAAGIILNMPAGQFFNPQLITKLGLDIVASKYPASVTAGIEALRQMGLPPNWELPKQ